MNTTQDVNFIRSATAPEISAGVMIANMSWNSRNTESGMPSPSSRPISVPKPSSPSAKNSRFPISPRPCQSPLNASE